MQKQKALKCQKENKKYIIFGSKLENTIAKFEISSLEFVKYEFLTNLKNLYKKSACSKGPE